MLSGFFRWIKSANWKILILARLKILPKMLTFCRFWNTRGPKFKILYSPLVSNKVTNCNSDDNVIGKKLWWITKCQNSCTGFSQCHYSAKISNNRASSDFLNRCETGFTSRKVWREKLKDQTWLSPNSFPFVCDIEGIPYPELEKI